MIPPYMFFIDPILRAPTLAAMFMGFACGMIGVSVFVRKQSLLGETLAHATYPGVTLGVLISALYWSGKGLPLFILGGAFVMGLLALFFIEKFRDLRISEDSTLSLVLSAFFGIGVTLASYVQFAHSKEYRQIQAYLYGQAATMTDIHVLIYGIFLIGVIVIISIFYKELQTCLFDPLFAKTTGLFSLKVRIMIHILLVLSIVIGIRSVGVILMSAMLIGPPIAARQFTQKLSKMFFLSGVLGSISAFLGIALSYYLSEMFFLANIKVFLPTGPSIVLVIAFIAFLSLLFAPSSGLVIRFIRIAYFRFEKMSENLLKNLWHLSQQGRVHVSDVQNIQGFSKFYFHFLFFTLWIRGLLHKKNQLVYLTPKGKKRGAHIVRLHRLWELYLVNLGVGASIVHRNAEEMEHVITLALEKELTDLLQNPKVDPHQQPIPSLEEEPLK